MILYKSNRQYAVPQTLEVRLEIAKAIRKLFDLDTVAKFDPNQPRVPAGHSDGGQWTDGQEAKFRPEGDGTTTVAAQRISPAKEAECEAQHARDIFQCKMVGLRACYEQAALRYANCLAGLDIPPLIYF